MRGLTRIEKIVSKFSLDKTPARQGDFIAIRPHKVMTHDNTAAVMLKFKSMNASFYDPTQAVFTLDHDVQNKSEKNLKKYLDIQEFAKSKKVDFYPAGSGIGHQIMVEQGYCLPNTLTVASDSHSNMYGGLGCLGTPIVRTDAAAIWATGQTWWQVPLVAQVEFKNSLPQGVTGKDVIITLCSLFNKDEVLNCAVEFTGSVGKLSMDERLTIANMTTEWGALAGVFPIDSVTIDWLENHKNERITPEFINNLKQNPLDADSDAFYARKITLDLSTVSPIVSGPNSVKIATPLNKLQSDNIPIQKAYLVSCTNSRLSDIKQAANVVDGKKVAPGVEFYISAASASVQKQAEEKGYWKKLIDAGAKPLISGCGPCIGLGAGLLKDGEVGISATNRNYKGRMGSPRAKAYLASPEVVAASAISGKICGPYSDLKEPVGSCVSFDFEQSSEESPLLPGFPSTLEGEIVFCDMDNINTDAIYPGKYTYQDDMTPEQMGKVAMENYDPNFKSQKDDILVAGYNFGTGSSREQAATCLLAAGIKLVVAGSFSETFKRNAINNGLLVLESPALLDYLRKNESKKALTTRLSKALVLLTKGTLRYDEKVFTLPKVGKAAQELILEGGLEQWTKNRLTK